VGDPAAGNNVRLVAHLDHEKEHIEAFHVPHFVRQVGQVRDKMLRGHRSDHDAHAVDIVACGPFDQPVQDRDLFRGELARDKVRYDVELGA
jgi:hypothetical protein